jgi:hypothetical protein
MKEDCEVTRLCEERNLATVRELLLRQNTDKAASNLQLRAKNMKYDSGNIYCQYKEIGKQTNLNEFEKLHDLLAVVSNRIFL